YRHDTLALARILAGAAVAGPSTGAVPLALVDARALHLVASSLFFGTGFDGAARKQRRRRRGDQDSLAGSSHRHLLLTPQPGDALRATGRRRPRGRFVSSGRARPATPSRARAIEGSNGSAAGAVRTAAPRRGDRRRVRERAGRPVRVR